MKLQMKWKYLSWYFDEDWLWTWTGFVCTAKGNFLVQPSKRLWFALYNFNPVFIVFAHGFLSTATRSSSLHDSSNDIWFLLLFTCSVHFLLFISQSENVSSLSTFFFAGLGFELSPSIKNRVQKKTAIAMKIQFPMQCGAHMYVDDVVDDKRIIAFVFSNRELWKWAAMRKWRNEKKKKYNLNMAQRFRSSLDYIVRACLVIKCMRILLFFLVQIKLKSNKVIKCRPNNNTNVHTKNGRHTHMRYVPISTISFI